MSLVLDAPRASSGGVILDAPGVTNAALARLVFEAPWTDTDHFILRTPWFDGLDPEPEPEPEPPAPPLVRYSLDTEVLFVRQQPFDIWFRG